MFSTFLVTDSALTDSALPGKLRPLFPHRLRVIRENGMQSNMQRHLGIRFAALATVLALLMPTQLNSGETAPRLEAIGSLAAAHVYTSYGFIAVTADAVTAGTVTEKQVVDLMNDVTNMIDINVTALRKVHDGVSNADQLFLNDLLLVYKLIRQEATALVTYTKSNKPEDGEAFEAARTAAWPKVKQLLGIE